MREVRPRLGFDPCIPVGVFAALLVIGCLTACTTAPPVQTLADGGTGRIAFQSVTVTTQEFLRGVGGGIPVVITGDLQRPQGPTEPVPAVVEELYFRGYLLPRMPWSQGWTPLINALLFSLYHFFSPWQNVTRIVALIPLVYAVSWKRNIYLSLFTHCTWNTLIMLWALARVAR